MRSKLPLVLLSIMTVQCKGHLPISDVISAHKRMHATAKDITSSILKEISQGLNINLGHDPQIYSPYQRPSAQTPEETIILVIEDDNNNKGPLNQYQLQPLPPQHKYPPPTPPQYRHPPPPPHHRHPPPPPHHRHPPPPHHRHPPPPPTGYDSSKEEFDAYQPQQNNPGRPDHFEHQNNWHQHNHHHNDGHFNKPGWNNFGDKNSHRPGQELEFTKPSNKPDIQNNMNYEIHGDMSHNISQRPNQGFEINGPNNNYTPKNPNQGQFSQNYPQNPNVNFGNKPYYPSFPNNPGKPDGSNNPNQGKDSHKNPINGVYNYEQNGDHESSEEIGESGEKTSSVFNNHNQYVPTESNYPDAKPSTVQPQNVGQTKDSKDNSPFSIPTNQYQVEGQTNSTAPKRDTDKENPANDDDDDTVFPIDVRFNKE